MRFVSSKSTRLDAACEDEHRADVLVFVSFPEAESVGRGEGERRERRRGKIG